MEQSIIQESNDNLTPEYIIGVGASAGGLESLQELLSNFPEQLNDCAIIIAQHLSPTYKSMLVQLLGRNTHLNVGEAFSGQAIEAAKVYITPPNSDITIQNGMLFLSTPHTGAGPKPSVDTFFHSLGRFKKDKAIGIILSGTGSDGSKGLRDIKMNGGIAVVQDPDTAKYDGMPMSAIELCDVDIIAKPSEIGTEILNYLENKDYTSKEVDVAENLDHFEKIIEMLSQKSKTDFSNYKRNSIRRRLSKRLQVLNLRDKKEYIEFIERNPEELDNLFSVVLIGVTQLFRDALSFKALEESLKKILSQKKKGDSIRVWIPGCASGEEPYTVAIIIHKILGSSIGNFTVQIFGTDINENSLANARRGIYAQSAFEEVEQDIIDKYFIHDRGSYEVIKPIKQMVLFSRHDLISSPPFLRLDLLSCRNLLIYFNATLQKIVIPIFNYSLNDNGILFLGKSESIGQYSDLFISENETHKIYIKKTGQRASPIRFPLMQIPKNKTHIFKKHLKPTDSITEITKDTIYSTFEHSFVVINEDMDILEVKGDVRPYMGLSTGTINANILKLINRDLQVEMRSILSNVVKNKTMAKTPILKTESFNASFYIRLIAKPLLYNDQRNDLFIIIFERFEEDELVFNSKKGEGVDESTRVQELENELNTAKEHLQNFIEELESNNEELQSLNEEFQATNEELQSTNEEMQIAYSELKAANTHLEKKEKELTQSQENIKALLNNTLQAFILLNKDFKIVTYNLTARELFHKLSGHYIDEGEVILNYLQPEYIEKFHKDFSAAKLGNSVEGIFSINLSLDDVRWFRYNFTPIENELSNKDPILSYSLLDVSEHYKTRLDLKETKKIIDSVFTSADIGICITDSEAHFIDVNNGFCELLGYSKEELIDKQFWMIVPKPNIHEGKRLYNASFKTGSEILQEWKLQRKDGSFVEVSLHSSILVRENGEKIKITHLKDVTENKKYKNLLQDTQDAVSVGGWEIDLITNNITWTKEVYKIHEVPLDFNLQPYNFYTFFEPDSLHRLLTAMSHSTETGEPFKLELQFITARKNKRWVRITCRAIREHEKTTKLFFTIQDITEEKLVKEEVMKLSLVASKTTNAVIIDKKSSGSTKGLKI